MMRIQLITNYFPPEIGGASHLFYELATSLAAKGQSVTVITGFPRYNIKDVDDKYKGKLVFEEEMDGIRLLRVRTLPVPVHNRIARGIDHFSIALTLAIRALLERKNDVVLIYSPPLPLGLSAWLVRLVKGTPFVVNIQDLFPQEAIDLGLLNNHILIQVFWSIESFIYRMADHISVHSLGNRQYVIQHGGWPDKVTVIHNWVDTERIRPGNRNNSFAAQHNLDRGFVISYAGTMGWCQDMTVIVRAAALLRDYKDIQFLLVGDGTEKDQAENLARSLELTNLHWLPMQPWDIYPEILAASHVSMINLNENLHTPVVPSKLLSIMAAGRPVVASLPLTGDAPKIVEEAMAGLCVGPGDAVGLANSLLRLYFDEELRTKMGRNGRQYAETHFSREACVNQYIDVFNTVSKRH